MRKIILLMIIVSIPHVCFAMSIKSITDIFISTTNLKPKLVHYVENDDTKHIIGVSDEKSEVEEQSYLFDLISIGGNWAILKKISLENNGNKRGSDEYDDYYEFDRRGDEETITSKYIKENNSDYIYFEGAIYHEGTMWNDILLYRQFLYNIDTAKLYRLRFEGGNDTDPEYINVNDFADNGNILKLFSEQSKKSKFLSKYAGKSKDIDSIDNYKKKFFKLNSNIYDNYYKNSNVSYKVDTCVYEENKLYKKLSKEIDKIDDEYTKINNIEHIYGKSKIYMLGTTLLIQKNGKDTVIWVEPVGHNNQNMYNGEMEVIENNIFFMFGEYDNKIHKYDIDKNEITFYENK